MIILPTIYRSDNIRRFIECYKKTEATLQVLIVLDETNIAPYMNLVLPPTMSFMKITAGTRIGDIFNRVFQAFPNEPFYGIMADDVTPETDHWDVLLRDACLPDKIAWGFDGGHDETLPRHPFIGGDLVRKLGFIAPPLIKHWYVDNAWQDIANALDCGAYLPEVRMVHRHYTSGLAVQDRTYAEQPDTRTDEISYRHWKKTSFPLPIEKLKCPIANAI